MTDKTAAIYCRISKDAEGERVGVERQEAECRELAAAKGLSVEEVFIDNDTGASDRTRRSKVRHQYALMLEAVRAGRVKHIVSYSNSRLTRRMMELEDLVQLHRSTGVRMHTVVSGEDDLSTADGLMVARVKASVDAAEADRISERMKTALRHRAQSGEPRVTSRRPFGWKADGKTLEPTEAEVIRRGVQDLIGGASLNTIRKEWMRRGLKTPTGGSEWHWNNTKQVLTSWRTVGVRTYNGEVLLDADGKPVQGKWETIVTPEEREAALLQLQARSRTVTHRRSGKYWLSGLLRCGECGKPMWGNRHVSMHRKNTYICSGSGHVAIDQDRLDTLVHTAVHARLVNRELNSSAEEKLEEAQELVWPEEARLATVLGQIDELMAAWRRRELSGTVVFAQVGVLEKELAELRERRTIFFAKRTKPAALSREQFSVDAMMEFMKNFDNGSLAHQAAVLRQEIDVIVIRKGIKGVGSRTSENFASRVDIVWRD